MSGGVRVLLYSQDGNGLGHLRRTTTIANALAAARPDASLLLACDSPAAPFFKLSARADVVRLPQLVKVDTGIFRPGRLEIDTDVVAAMRRDMLCRVATRFEPDLVLVDHMPAGPNRELVPMLRSLRHLGPDTKIVLGIRDVIDDPAVARAVWRREGAYEVVRDFYDRVLVYGSSDVIPTADAMEFPNTIRARVRYCGYLCNLDPTRDPRRIRRDLRSDLALVVAVAGGGWDAFELHRTFIEAFGMLRSQRPAAGLVITGPFMPDGERRRLRERGRGSGVRVRRRVGDARAYYRAADLVVSMGGYNTLIEVLASGTRAVVVPRRGPSAEQRIRSQAFADRGLIDVVDPAELGPETLASVVGDGLCRARVAYRREALPLDGLHHATEALIELLPSPERFLPGRQIVAGSSSPAGTLRPPIGAAPRSGARALPSSP